MKFDTPYPYGDKQDAFSQVAKDVAGTPDLLVVEVPVQDFGTKDNIDLAEKYGASKANFPVLQLFQSSLKDPVVFDKEWAVDNIKAFIRREAGIRLVLDKCLPEFDELAEKFMQSSGDVRTTVLDEASAKAKSLSTEEQKNIAENYVKLMQKVAERGDKFIESEKARVTNLMTGKISETKKAQLQARLNVLHSFELPVAKDEL